ncbi:MAG: hypothetical protein ABSC26_09880 [Stellaceae bacterium]
MNSKSTNSLSPELKEIALEALNAYLYAPVASDGKTPIQIEAEWDRERIEIIEKKLRPLVTNYLNGSIPLVDFKRQVDGINKQNPLWGFSGIKGQMFFNMLLNTAEDKSECDTQIKAAIRVPTDEGIAIRRLRDFKSYVDRVGQKYVDAGGTLQGRPRSMSIPFFASYFWQVQDQDIWPVYYTNTVQMIEGMNLWQETGEIGDDYVSYKNLHEALSGLFAKASGKHMNLYDVEHVFWFKSGNLIGGATPIETTKNEKLKKSNDESAPGQTKQNLALIQTSHGLSLPDSYIPPIISVIPKLALNDSEVQTAARNSGTTADVALEKYVNAAFAMLGYEIHPLGKGMGRVPDGIALAINDSYALIWDAKARADGYRMGTDDRVIREYIDTSIRDVKRRGIRNVYYLLISSGFADGFDESIRSLKMDTEIKEVCLLEATALVAMVDQKLRAPWNFTLGPEGIQQIFSSGGIVTVNTVREIVS